MWHDKTRNWPIFIKIGQILKPFCQHLTNFQITVEVCSAYNTVISPNYLVWKFSGKVQFLQRFGRFGRNYAETVPFHKIRWNCNIFRSTSFRVWVFQRWLNPTDFQLDFFKLFPLKFFRGIISMFTETCSDFPAIYKLPKLYLFYIFNFVKIVFTKLISSPAKEFGRNNY